MSSQCKYEDGKTMLLLSLCPVNVNTKMGKPCYC